MIVPGAELNRAERRELKKELRRQRRRAARLRDADMSRRRQPTPPVPIILQPWYFV